MSNVSPESHVGPLSGAGDCRGYSRQVNSAPRTSAGLLPFRPRASAGHRFAHGFSLFSGSHFFVPRAAHDLGPSLGFQGVSPQRRSGSAGNLQAGSVSFVTPTAHTRGFRPSLRSTKAPAPNSGPLPDESLLSPRNPQPWPFSRSTAQRGSSANQCRTRALQRTAPGRLRVSRWLLPADPPRSQRATLRRPSAVSELESL